jgi:metal iron transporter
MLGKILTDLCSIGVGIIGATVMPHGLFLGSALATQDRLGYLPAADETNRTQPPELKEIDSFTDSTVSSRQESLIDGLKGSVRALFRAPPPSEYATTANSHAEHENRPYGFVKAHIYHGAVDLVINLMFIAVAVNSM